MSQTVEPRRVARRRLRRLTLTTAAAAVTLNAGLLAQTASGELPGVDFQGAIVSFLNAALPGGGLRPAPSPSASAPTVSPHAVTGAS